MSRQVFGEVIGSGKRFAASVASVRTLTSVDPQVTVHVALATKGSTTELALKRPLARVLPDVQFQVLFCAETLAAEWA